MHSFVSSHSPFFYTDFYWIQCTLNSAYNEVAFNENSAITKENLCTKYTYSPINTLCDRDRWGIGWRENKCWLKQDKCGKCQLVTEESRKVEISRKAKAVSQPQHGPFGRVWQNGTPSGPSLIHRVSKDQHAAAVWSAGSTC